MHDAGWYVLPADDTVVVCDLGSDQAGKCVAAQEGLSLA